MLQCIISKSIKKLKALYPEIAPAITRSCLSPPPNQVHPLGHYQDSQTSTDSLDYFKGHKTMSLRTFESLSISDGSLYPEEAMMLRGFAISPSYQSELSDCSFYPPTMSSRNPVFSPPADAIPEEDLSNSLDLLLPNDKCFYSPHQLCPCAMEYSGSCASCARY